MKLNKNVVIRKGSIFPDNHYEFYRQTRGIRLYLDDRKLKHTHSGPYMAEIEINWLPDEQEVQTQQNESASIQTP